METLPLSKSMFSKSTRSVKDTIWFSWSVIMYLKLNSIIVLTFLKVPLNRSCCRDQLSSNRKPQNLGVIFAGMLKPLKASRPNTLTNIPLSALKPEDVIGHREVAGNKTECPGTNFDMDKY